MKIAKLPNGKTLKFADDMPDSAIDAVAREHMKDHIQKTQANEQKEKESLQEARLRHQDLLQGLSGVIEALNANATLLQSFITQATQGHHELLNGIKETTKAVKTPKKTKLIRDEKTGKATGAEEYF